MTGLYGVLVLCAVGIDTGWEPAENGQLEYIIQIEPDLLELMREGQPIRSELPPDLQGVKRLRIQVGTGPLPRHGTLTVARPAPAAPPTAPARALRPTLPAGPVPPPVVKPVYKFAQPAAPANPVAQVAPDATLEKKPVLEKKPAIAPQLPTKSPLPAAAPVVAKAPVAVPETAAELIGPVLDIPADLVAAEAPTLAATKPSAAPVERPQDVVQTSFTEPKSPLGPNLPTLQEMTSFMPNLSASEATAGEVPTLQTPTALPLEKSVAPVATEAPMPSAGIATVPANSSTPAPTGGPTLSGSTAAALLLLFGSLGANGFLTWALWGQRNQYLRAIRQLHH